MKKRNVVILLLFAVFLFVFGSSMTVLADDEYLLPESATKYLSLDDILGYTQQWLNYARNEIYARHGRQFVSQELMDYFNSTDWYNGTIPPDQFDESVLNEYERVNAEFLWGVEYENDPDGYKLDEPGYDIYALAVNDIQGAALTEQEAYGAVYRYLDQEIGMDTVYEYSGYLIASEDQAGQAEENEYVFMFRSYTSFHIFYYVNAFTGDVYAANETMVMWVFDERKFLFNALGMDTEASTKVEPEYELMLEDNTYFTTMLSKTNGNPDGLQDSISTYVYEYAYKDSVFILAGSLIQGEWSEYLQCVWPSERDVAHYLPNKIRGFACDENTQFIAVSGESPVQHFTPQEFVEYAIECKDSGLALIVEVANGVAVELKIAS